MAVSPGLEKCQRGSVISVREVSEMLESPEIKDIYYAPFILRSDELLHM